MQKQAVRFGAAAARAADDDGAERVAETERERVTKMLLRLCRVDTFDELAPDQRHIIHGVCEIVDSSTRSTLLEEVSIGRTQMVGVGSRVPRTESGWTPSDASREAMSTSGSARAQDPAVTSSATLSQTNVHGARSQATRGMRCQRSPLPHETLAPPAGESMAAASSSTSSSRRVENVKPLPAYLRPTKASAARDASRKALNEKASVNSNTVRATQNHALTASRRPKKPPEPIRPTRGSRPGIRLDDTANEFQLQRSANTPIRRRFVGGTGIINSPSGAKLTSANNLIVCALKHVQQASRWKVDVSQGLVSLFSACRQDENCIERSEEYCLADDAKAELLHEASAIEDAILDCYDSVNELPNDCTKKVELCMNLLQLQMTASHVLACISDLVLAIDSCKGWMTRVGKTQVPNLSLGRIRAGDPKDPEQTSSHVLDVEGLNHQVSRIHCNLDLVMAELAVCTFVAHVHDRWISLQGVGDSLDHHYTTMVMIVSTLDELKARYARCCELLNAWPSSVPAIPQPTREWFADVQNQYWTTIVVMQTKLIECSKAIYSDCTDEVPWCSAIFHPDITVAVRDGQCIEFLRQSVFKFVGLHVQITRSVSQIETESKDTVRGLVAQLLDELKMLKYWSLTVAASERDRTLQRDYSKLLYWVHRLLKDVVRRCFHRVEALGLSERCERADLRFPNASKVGRGDEEDCESK